MAKYKCPKCGTIYNEIPRFCATCGVEFLPAEEQDKPASVAAEPAPVVEPAPVEEKPVEQAPAEDKPVEQAPVEEKPAEEKPAEEKPAEKPRLEPNNGEASELNISSEKEKMPARVVVGFIFALLSVICNIGGNSLVYFQKLDPQMRVYLIAGLVFGGLVCAIVALAAGGKPRNYTKGHALAVATRVIGIIFLIISILDTIAWGAVTVMYMNSAKLESTLKFSFKETVDTYLTTGKIVIKKLS